jgi:SAM-dependent methyltransferase
MPCHASVVSAWSSYLDRFHDHRPGITEAVFARLERDQGSVEDWILGADVEDGRVLDVACGSSPLSERLQGRWLGIDRSDAELALARSRGAGPFVRS